MSEFEGDARAGLHGMQDDRWTEEYQANIYRHQLGMLNRIAQPRGMSPWILMDVRSPSRQLPGEQDYFDRKGLLSPDGQKKQAFYVLQKAYKEKSVGKADEPQCRLRTLGAIEFRALPLFRQFCEEGLSC